MTEKLYYGTSVNDAFLPITKWMYRDQSDTQYELSEFYEPSDDSAGDGPAYDSSDMPAADSSSGVVEHYGYDWRMRKVSTKYTDFRDINAPVHREERLFYDNIDRVRFTAVYGPHATGSAPNPDILPGSDLPDATDFLGAGAADNLLSLEETVYNQAGQVTERRRYDPAGVGGYLVTHSYSDHADRATWSSSSSGRVTRNVYDAKGRMVKSSDYAVSDVAEIEISRSVQQYGPDDRLESVAYYERIGTGTGPVDQDPHRLSVSYTWYDSAGRVIANADMGTAEFDTTSPGAYDRVIPARPQASPEITAKLVDFLTTSGQSSTSERRLLVGVEYPDAFFDSVTGDAIARITCSWYDRLGKQNAMLTVHDAHRDPVTGDKAVEYTIDRMEYNRYGQKVLEHNYAYIGNGSSFTSGDFELLGGTEYGFEAEIYLQGEETPRLVTTTQVRTITPLSTDPSVMQVLWQDHDENLGTGPNGEPLIGLGRFYTDWLDETERRSTFLEYGAPIINPDQQLPSYVLNPPGSLQFPIESNDWGHLGISNRPDLIKAVHLPNPDTGETGDGLGYTMFFFYYPDGLPAIRVDSRGVSIRYVYDADGNLTRLSSDDSNIPLIIENPSMGDSQRPPNAIEYTYDALSRLLSITTGRDFADGSFHRRSRSDMEYTSLGNLARETQRRYEEYDDPTNPNPLLETAGVVDYDWDTRLLYSSNPTQPVNTIANLVRLHSITYPNRVGTHDDGSYSPRVVTLGYGVEGGISDLIDRVESLTSTGGPVGGELGHVASYRYNGLNRLAGIDLGDVPGQSSQTFAQTDDRAFDIFGRVTNRHVESFAIGSGQHQQVMDSDFGYDLRGQRLYERLTQLDHPSIGSRDNTHSSFFEYDALGRLVGEHHGSLLADNSGLDTALSGRIEQFYGLDSLNRRVGTSSTPGIEVLLDGVLDMQQSHVIDERGALLGFYDGSAPVPDGVVTDPVGQDEAGAITELHGRTIYHDWLGRPVLVIDRNSTPGDSTDDPAVFSVDYDGFGRVAQRRAPWPGTDPDDGIQRIETYFYDGVRRIQEVFDDPKASIPPWPVQAPGGFGGGGGYTGHTQRTEAEFIWSAASGQPFDTCHVQIDWWDREAWFIQDHQAGTVRAYTDANGEMVRQYRFDAFGNLLNLDAFDLGSANGLFSNFQNRIGHHGLFAERMDSDTRATVFAPSGPELWYQSRSRWYVPELGRFMTSDPNATGVPTMQTLAMLGRMPAGPPSGSFDAMNHYGDGWDIHTAYRANPKIYQDPNGLFLGAIGFGISMFEGMYGSADDALATVEAGYETRGTLEGGLDLYYALQDGILSFIDSMFETPTSSSNRGAYTAGANGLAVLFLVNGRRPINSRFAGRFYPLNSLSPELQQKYPKSVYFNKQGFPDFTPYAKAEISSPQFTGDHNKDARFANSLMGYTRTPVGYTWHHVEVGPGGRRTLQLVPTDIHDAVKHTGGVAQYGRRRTSGYRRRGGFRR